MAWQVQAMAGRRQSAQKPSQLCKRRTQPFCALDDPGCGSLYFLHDLKMSRNLCINFKHMIATWFKNKKTKQKKRTERKERKEVNKVNEDFLFGGPVNIFPSFFQVSRY